MRDDIAYGHLEYEGGLPDAIWELANPILNGSVTIEASRRIRASLDQ